MRHLVPFELKKWEKKERRGIGVIRLFVLGLIFEEAKDREEKQKIRSFL